MKTLTCAVLALLLLSTAGCYFRLPPYPYDMTYIPDPCPPPVAPPDREQWQPIGAGPELQVFARRELFGMTDQVHLYVCIQVLNTTQRGLVVDLHDADCIVCPMGWEATRTPATSAGATGSAPSAFASTEPTPRLRLGLVDGLSPQRRARLVKDYVDEKLVSIPPRSTVEYYCELPAPSPARSLKAGQELTVRLAGMIAATNAAATMALVIPPAQPQTVRLTVPAQPQLVPMGAVIMKPTGPTILVPTTNTAPEND